MAVASAALLQKVAANLEHNYICACLKLIDKRTAVAQRGECGTRAPRDGLPALAGRALSGALGPAGAIACPKPGAVAAAGVFGGGVSGHAASPDIAIQRRRCHLPASALATAAAASDVEACRKLRGTQVCVWVWGLQCFCLNCTGAVLPPAV